ncbi:MAG: PTS sugar transporter subunit IIB [Treponema sp.]|jgi:PTS system ascorbate-specific IIB component|nr:PTS sugar transporter subunit IIB [Treponema sp.]
MKILAVCGFGCGSSMILKMSIDKAVSELGIPCETDICDVSSAKGTPCDAIFTSAELAGDFRSGTVPVYAVKKYLDLREVKTVTEQFFRDKKLLPS